MRYLLIATACFSLSAYAEPYRCNIDGRAVFQSTPCHRSGALVVEPEGRPLYVPSDSGAKYWILQSSERPGAALQTITTKRVGRSGTTYSRREYDCQNEKVRYLASGETYDAMLSSKPGAQMAPIFPGSIADVVGLEACKAFRR